MPLIKSFARHIHVECLSILSVVWIGLQLKGYYWFLAVLLVFLLLGLKDSLVSRFLATRQLFLAAFLLIFSLALFLSAFIDFGLKGLLSDIPVVFPILPIFVFSCVALWQRRSGVVFASPFVLYSFAIGILIAIEAIWRGFLLSDSPASSLRPLEVQSSSGIFLATAIAISTSFHSSVSHLKSHRSFYFGLFSFLLSGLAFICFRGAASASSFLVNIFAISLLHLFPAMRALGPLLLLLPLSFAALVIALLLDLRFLFLKYILAPFVMDDIGNGRLSLLYTWISYYGQDPLHLIGSQSTVPPDFFVHNLIFDSMIKDGLIPAAAFLMFSAFAFLFLVRDLYKCFDAHRLLNLTMLVLMALPAMLQPVQFSHAFGFLLSISTVGILTSMSVDHPIPVYPRVSHS